MAKRRRNVLQNYDQSGIETLTFNPYAGAQKNVQAGGSYDPLRSTGVTANSAAVEIPAGSQLAVYNNSGTVGTIIFTDNAANATASGTPGTMVASKFVELPLKANDWSYFSSGENTFIRTNNASQLVFILKDDTLMKSDSIS